MTIALALFLLTSAGGLALLVAGVYLLAGLGWAFLAGGVCMLCAAAFLRAGMREPVRQRGVKGG